MSRSFRLSSVLVRERCVTDRLLCAASSLEARLVTTANACSSQADHMLHV